MIKFVVVLYRKPGTTPEQFRDYFVRVHGPLAAAIPGLLRYVQNFAAADPKRAHPGWDAIIELYFDSSDAMETAWATREGGVATEDLENFADLARSTWGVVDEISVWPPPGSPSAPSPDR